MEFDFEPEHNGDCAGLVVYLNEDYYYRIYKKRQENRDYIVFERQMDDANIIAYREEIGNGTIKLKLETDGRQYCFYYSTGGEYKEAGCGSVKFLSTNIAGKCFTGNLVGLFAECDKETNARMKIYYFHMNTIKKQ